MGWVQDKGARKLREEASGLVDIEHLERTGTEVAELFRAVFHLHRKVFAVIGKDTAERIGMAHRLCHPLQPLRACNDPPDFRQRAARGRAEREVEKNRPQDRPRSITEEPVLRVFRLRQERKRQRLRLIGQPALPVWVAR